MRNMERGGTLPEHFRSFSAGGLMPEPVRCDVCGKLFSSRHVSSHKRLAHPKNKQGWTSEDEQVRTIVELFQTLSSEHKQSVLARLRGIVAEKTPS